ncbi:MAG: heavy-metal-associated domain-containing protein [Desulfobacterales bacterium]
MTKKTFVIPNISCGHCVNAIKTELSEIGGVYSIEGDPANRTIDVEWDTPATETAIREALKEINYPAQ